MELISVIIPIYNVEKYLARCLESVITNSYKNLEIICVNDGSTDDSLNIIEEYALNDNRIITVTQKNSGLSAARNTGLRNATGEYVIFIDSDDWVHPQHIETLYSLAKENKADIVVGNNKRTEKPSPSYSNIDINHCLCTQISINEFFSDITIKYYAWGKIYKKSLIKNIKFHEEVRYLEDTIFNAEVMYTNPDASVFKVDEVLYYYFVRTDSICSTVKCKTILNAIQQMEKIIAKWDYNNPFYKQYLLEVIKQSLSLRYQCWVFRDDINKKNSNILIANHLKKAKKIKTNGLIKYQIMYYMPFLYRFWRLHNDPSLCMWEKNIRSNINGKHR